VRGRVDVVLEQVRLTHRRTHRADELSGGEMQRVSIARALVIEPALLLADEPTGNLDSRTGDEILRLLHALVTERGCTSIMVTHDANAASGADRIVEVRDGRIIPERPAGRGVNVGV
jgi:putative ABC transport system ATP-binding protein